jgi:ATP-dependent exoDNAse (exonuclease V) beta subunit
MREPPMNDAGALARQDDAARALALDITRSWLVQAPAGSGKTALLIERFLALLASVDRPERIVATTFTRKAAAEMRDRVLQALRDAGDADCAAPVDGHERRMRELAHAALERDRRMSWRLLEQPGRLRIVTIDALAAALARQAPLAAGLGALPGFVDDAQMLYRDAARAALAEAAADDPHWQTFLQWQDNDADNATRLIAELLATRDRWPARMFAEDPDALRADMEHALEQEIRDAIGIVRERLPAALATALPLFARIALEHFALADEPPAFAGALEALARSNALPGPDERIGWCALADWLLTKGGTFVQSIGARHGFAAKGTGAGAAERARRKADLARWLSDAARVPGLAEAWHRLRQLPPPRFDDAAWAFVVATMRVLPRAAKALDRTFAARGQADFAEATLRALFALGAPGDPSDLLLAIDYRLSHLLIDEFQDTSAAQLALIGRLTEGWDAGDGRTLFAVGDPMQSIYRFRHAEVRLFLDAQARGEIASVPVGVVELARNFRSQPAIVDWVNDVFRAVLPPVSDPARGEAAYRPAYPAAPGGVDIAPTLDLAGSREAEAEAVVRRIVEARAAGFDDIAVLVRARAHAQSILPALRRAGIAYSAVDLEGLHDRPATRDLLALARALAQPADRLAWLSVLRAPWCGLALADLLAIADHASSARLPIVEAIGLPEVIVRLTPDGRARLAHVVAAITPALASRGDAHFAMRVRGAWLALGGPACAVSPLDRDGADRVLALLAEHARDGDLADFGTLVATAERLFAEAGPDEGTGVQVMTLHRAKGLQFDVVLLPGLDQESGRGDDDLLRWNVREHAGERTVVLAPMRARVGAAAEPDPIYAWLGRLDAAEEAAELGRLLYVGATRARRRLHWLAVAEAGAREEAAAPAFAWKRPKGGTALERLWDALGARMPPASAQTGTTQRSAGLPVPAPLMRLPTHWRVPAAPPPLPVARIGAARTDAPVFDWADATAAAIGTVAHRLLAQVARDGLGAWDERRVRDERPRILAELGGEGVEPDQRESAAQRVTDVVSRTLRDPRGRWLFDPAHGDARSEWALAGEDDGSIVHVVLDRTFIAEGVRYVVDFKTGAHLGGDPTTFLAREFERYRPQLARYARIVRALDPRPVRVALYHPLVDGGWQEHDAPR